MVELHCHLDGSISVEIARKLAALQGISLPSEDEGELEKLFSVPESCESLTEFLKCFEWPGRLLQSQVALREAVALVLEKKAAEGLRYIELRFAPQLHCAGGMSQEQAVLAALDGVRTVCGAVGDIHCNLILCCMRGADTHCANMETVRLAGKYLVEDGGVVALDLAGAEALFKTSDYAGEFAEARRLGVPFTIHAGEADGWESVKCALDFGAVRIGHGVRVKENPELLKYIVKKGIALEMCPNSNRQTKAVEDMKDYPLREFLQAGVKVTVSTDDPAICRTDLKNEYEYLHKNYGLSPEEEKRLLLNSVDAAFTSEKVKEELRCAVICPARVWKGCRRQGGTERSGVETER